MNNRFHVWRPLCLRPLTIKQIPITRQSRKETASGSHFVSIGKNKVGMQCSDASRQPPYFVICKKREKLCKRYYRRYERNTKCSAIMNIIGLRRRHQIFSSSPHSVKPSPVAKQLPSTFLLSHESRASQAPHQWAVKNKHFCSNCFCSKVAWLFLPYVYMGKAPAP